MMWLWLSLCLSWSVLAAVVGLLLGAAMRIADQLPSVADEVEAWLRWQTAEHQPG